MTDTNPTTPAIAPPDAAGLARSAEIVERMFSDTGPLKDHPDLPRLREEARRNVEVAYLGSQIEKPKPKDAVQVLAERHDQAFDFATVEALAPQIDALCGPGERLSEAGRKSAVEDLRRPDPEEYDRLKGIILATFPEGDLSKGLWTSDAAMRLAASTAMYVRNEARLRPGNHAPSPSPSRPDHLSAEQREVLDRIERDPAFAAMVRRMT